MTIQVTQVPIRTLKEVALRHGTHFFSRVWARIFRSRLPENVHTFCDGGHTFYVFVTSEQRDWDTPRMYTVRLHVVRTDDEGKKSYETIQDGVPLTTSMQHETRSQATSAMNRWFKDMQVTGVLHPSVNAIVNRHLKGGCVT
jgi:hypothetical protein